MLDKIETIGFWIELPIVAAVTASFGIVLYETFLMFEHSVNYLSAFGLLTALWLCCIFLLYKSYKRKFK